RLPNRAYQHSNCASTRSTPSCQGGNCNANACLTLPVSSREFSGRRAGLGHWALAIGLSVSIIHGSLGRLAASARRAKVLGAPPTPSCPLVFPHPADSKVDCAYPFHDVSPAAATWYSPAFSGAVRTTRSAW